MVKDSSSYNPKQMEITPLPTLLLPPVVVFFAERYKVVCGNRSDIKFSELETHYALLHSHAIKMCLN